MVSRVEPPANRAYVPEPIERAPSLVDADGDTVIVALERQRLGPNATQSTVWLVSPDYPDGLEIEGPAPDLTANFILSPDGATLYTTASERQSGPEDLWMTPLGKQQVWETVAEDVTVRTFVPLASEE